MANTEHTADEFTPDLSEISAGWDPRPIHHHAGQGVRGNRRVIRLPHFTWPSTPEKCTAGPGDTEWILDGRILLCTGCGLNVT